MLALVLCLPALVVNNEASVNTALRMRGGLALDTKTLNLAGALYHGSFGVALYADPNAFADSGASPVKYTADAEGPVGLFTGRAFGGMMLGMASLYLFDPESEGATKMYATVMALFSPILLKCISDGEPAFKKKMWIAQAFMHLPFTALMLYKAFK
jgi:hypothetical protein